MKRRELILGALAAGFTTVPALADEPVRDSSSESDGKPAATTIPSAKTKSPARPPTSSASPPRRPPSGAARSFRDQGRPTPISRATKAPALSWSACVTARAG